MTEQSAEDAERFHQVSLGSVSAKLIPTGSSLPGRKRYLFYFLHRHLNFRLAEAEALAERAYGSAVVEADGLPPIVWEEPPDGFLASPFWFAHLPCQEIAESLATDCLLVRCIIELDAEGNTLDELKDNITALGQEFRDHWGGLDTSFKFVVESYARSITTEEKVAVINQFEAPTQFKGKIDLKNPMVKWWVIMIEPQHTNPVMPPLPQHYYFGREVMWSEARTKLVKYDLKMRRYIGPTSMDAELSFIMCNVAKVRKHSLVLDPNVGTGSILVSAAAQGAITMGCDIDIRVVKLGRKDGKGENVNVWTNFKDYGLPAPVGLFRGDVNQPPLRDGLTDMFDAILADPPYGVRAGGRKSKADLDVLIKDRATHITGTQPYGLAECLVDLVELAAKLLVTGGRLVYWIPAAEGYYFESELPTHPSMKFIFNCEQVLATRYSRRMLVMEKIKAYNEEEAKAHWEACGPAKMALENMHEYIYMKKAEYEALAVANGKDLNAVRMRNKWV